MAVRFEPKQHKYISIDGGEIPWISVTNIIHELKQPFDTISSSKKCSKGKGKWGGIPADEIRTVWKQIADESCTLGNWYHNQREQDVLSCTTLHLHDKELPVICPMTDENGFKVASSQKLIEGIYPEHMVYLKSIGICGQIDRVEVVGDTVHIIDYKTNREIKASSYVNWEGVSQKMKAPLTHLDDCNMNHYNIQLSLYMYMILKHNPKLKPGNLILQHVKFAETGLTDKYGYPILAYNREEPVVQEVIPYHLPYMKDEVIAIIQWYKDNKHTLIKH